MLTNIMGVQANKEDAVIHKTGVVIHYAMEITTVRVMKQVLGATGTKETRATVIVCSNWESCRWSSVCSQIDFRLSTLA